jgi:hypothetical protein
MLPPTRYNPKGAMPLRLADSPDAKKSGRGSDSQRDSVLRARSSFARMRTSEKAEAEDRDSNAHEQQPLLPKLTSPIQSVDEKNRARA